MIVLDTNVISELLKGDRAHAGVVGWIRALGEQPVTTVINKAELLADVALLPAGRRRESLAREVNHALADLQFCLPFTAGVPVACAEIVATRTRSGAPIDTADAYIATIAHVHGAGVATRDVGGFAGTGLRVIDPWEAPAGIRD